MKSSAAIAKEPRPLPDPMAELRGDASMNALAKFGHELRSPLYAVLGFAQLLIEDDRLLAEHREMIEVIRTSGKHLLGLIQDVVQIAKLDVGHPQVELEPFELELVVRQVIEMMKLRAVDKGLALHVKFAQDLPRVVSGDSGKIRQILINLVGNAIAYTDSGEVDIDVQCGNRGPGSQVMIHFAVADSGPGIAEQDQGRVFDEFVRLTSRDPNGSGLGLAISQRLAELMGGAIRLESVVGQGSVFTLDLPLEPIEFEDDSQPLPAEADPIAVPAEPATAVHRLREVGGAAESLEIRQVQSVVTGLPIALERAADTAQGLRWRSMTSDLTQRVEAA